MYDPMTVAFDIRNPLKKYSTLLTIGHVDPERGGSDDSCGWFIRGRHCDQKKLDRIARDFAFEFSHGVPSGWFADNGEPNYSCQAITLGMFRIAANVHFGHWSRRSDRFLSRHLASILHFAENNCDSMFDFIVQPYGRDQHDTVESRSRRAASIVYSWICRADRPWWRHPRWHVWHWQLQIPIVQNFKRWLRSRCERCGRRFRWGEAPCSNNWNSSGPRWFRGETGLYHSSCDGTVGNQPKAAN